MKRGLLLAGLVVLGFGAGYLTGAWWTACGGMERAVERAFKTVGRHA